MLVFILFTNIFTYFLSSSVVEQSAVNRFVVGSNPTWGAFRKTDNE